MRRYTYRVITLAGLLVLMAAAGFAQNPPAPQGQGGEGPRGMGRVGRRHMPGGPRGPRLGLGRLNLSDAQREQLRQIESRYADSFRARREELRSIMQTRRQGGTLTAGQEARARQLREELRADSEKMRAEMRAVLTDEQRTQLQTMREEMGKRRELRRERRREFREQRRLRRQQRQQTPPTGTTDQL
ncbi:MAG TPA: Spy/CpxP family protein refolding chaperone [Pyrinomonadaceae bacterium]|nr:Spy/CpxP family protein refolding chaperone [Pyrinomonadaceae bacterium]